MASALEKIMKGTLQKSEAQKAFSPWWEDLESTLLYTLMILGMITLPFNMVSNTPVECTIDQKHPEFGNLSQIDQQPMRYHHFYLRKFCTMNFIHDAMIFLPFFLILTPLPIVGIEKVCLRYFKVQKRMDSFYKLVIKDSLAREDVEAMEKENYKNSHEILQMFRESNAIYHAVITKSLIQLVLGGLLTMIVFWIFMFGLAPENIQCAVFDQHYVCVVPLATFYQKIIVVAMVAMIGYVGCNFWMLLWVLFRNLSPFHAFMTNCYTHIDDNITLEKAGTKKEHYTKCLKHVEEAYPFFDIYLDPKSKDLGLLINLLSCTHGVAEGLRMLALFDKEYKLLWKPLQVKVYHARQTVGVVHVEWDDCPLAEYVYKYNGRISTMRIEYTAEITPNSEAPLKNHSYESKDWLAGTHWSDDKDEKQLKYKDDFCGVDVERPRRPKLAYQPRALRSVSVADSLHEDALSASGDGDKKKKVEMPKITISVEVNGRTIAQHTEKVPPAPYLHMDGSPVGFSPPTFFEEDEDAYLGDDGGEHVGGL